MLLATIDNFIRCPDEEKEDFPHVWSKKVGSARSYRMTELMQLVTGRLYLKQIRQRIFIEQKVHRDDNRFHQSGNQNFSINSFLLREMRFIKRTLFTMMKSMWPYSPEKRCVFFGLSSGNLLHWIVPRLLLCLHCTGFWLRGFLTVTIIWRLSWCLKRKKWLARRLVGNSVIIKFSRFMSRNITQRQGIIKENRVWSGIHVDMRWLWCVM